MSYAAEVYYLSAHPFFSSNVGISSNWYVCRYLLPFRIMHLLALTWSLGFRNVTLPGILCSTATSASADLDKQDNFFLQILGDPQRDDSQILSIALSSLSMNFLTLSVLKKNTDHHGISLQPFSGSCRLLNLCLHYRAYEWSKMTPSSSSIIFSYQFGAKLSKTDY